MNRHSYHARLQADLKRERRAIAARSPEDFANVYLKSICDLSFSRMHRELFAALREIVDKRRARLAIAAPRGHAKSTIVSLAFVLWCVLYEKEKLVYPNLRAWSGMKRFATRRQLYAVPRFIPIALSNFV